MDQIATDRAKRAKILLIFDRGFLVITQIDMINVVIKFSKPVKA
jgi:hypothetical protein